MGNTTKHTSMFGIRQRRTGQSEAHSNVGSFQVLRVFRGTPMESPVNGAVSPNRGTSGAEWIASVRLKLVGYS